MKKYMKSSLYAKMYVNDDSITLKATSADMTLYIKFRKLYESNQTCQYHIFLFW